MLSFQLDMLKHYVKDRFHLEERGAVTIEYGVITVFIALALIAVVGVLVDGVGTWFGNIAAFISGRPSSG